ncbi:MAG: RIP metalloprotease RseP [Candidatus Dadabacteria bacterium]|nr:RIP metalloprotease RseP [Candidatus Dadabacteria bacterium]NIS07885.1 RIP metalloprotease RseP [Candidatus Dadabacteria bacterium]NIV42905.1 RIP metalloprotease RseP [Candidatus Dadabacteria bacterium]NIX14875.1 RIP metalloprotease RseP [Candidatus Dadabacteria bacterium]NIY21489.1 RIP metalloprotease RseP [Candidatus Dadabacteria bacterium]
MFTVLGFLFVIGVLVFIHELGHFLVAKWSGVRVEKFSLGFGKKLLSFRRGETEYLISMLPLGGYVKMYGETGEGCIIVEDVEKGSNAEKLGLLSGDKITKIDGNELKEFSTWKSLLHSLKTSEKDEHEYLVERDDDRIRLNGSLDDIDGINAFSEKQYARGFSNQPLLNRFLIVIAGPLMNFFIPFVFFPIVFLLGIEQPAYLDKVPEIGYIQPESEAEKAGFEIGDKILKINDKPVSTWEEATIALQLNPDSKVSVIVDRAGTEKELSVNAIAGNQGIVSIGVLEPLQAIVGNVAPGTPAKDAGLKKGDKIISIDDVQINDWYQMSAAIKPRADKESTFAIIRDGKELSLKITPETKDNNQGQIGIGPLQEMVIHKYGLAKSITKGLQKAYSDIIKITGLLFEFLYKLVTGDIALSTAGKTIAGPLLIAQVSGAAAESGWATLLQFTSFISINLAIINLFPIPMLDGGHVVYIGLEAIRRRPLSEKAMEYSQKVGFSFLILLMFLAVFNDVSRLKNDIIKPFKKAAEYIK